MSGFSFIHNGLESGIPFLEAILSVWENPDVDEIVVVDMQSTDGTRAVLDKLGVKVIEGNWGNEAGATLKRAHAMYPLCQHEIVIHFEADEVYDPKLFSPINFALAKGYKNIAIHRLQLEQNFQRCRWYPEPVHRIFQRDKGIFKEGHTTNRHDGCYVIQPEDGVLWDVTNCFRNQWLKRVKKQAELWNEKPQYRRTPLHFLQDPFLSDNELEQFLQEPHWTWEWTPFDIPSILRPLVGKTEYTVRAL